MLDGHKNYTSNIHVLVIFIHVNVPTCLPVDHAVLIKTGSLESVAPCIQESACGDLTQL